MGGDITTMCRYYLRGMGISKTRSGNRNDNERDVKHNGHNACGNGSETGRHDDNNGRHHNTRHNYGEHVVDDNGGHRGTEDQI